MDYWMTINEPVATIIGGGYLAGVSPPGFFLDGGRIKGCITQFNRSSYSGLRQNQRYLMIAMRTTMVITKNVGFSHLMVIVKPVIENLNIEIKISKYRMLTENFSYFMNDYFLNAILNGEEDLNYLNTLERYNKDSKNFIVHNEWKQKTDFIGLNYYRE